MSNFFDTKTMTSIGSGAAALLVSKLLGAKTPAALAIGAAVGGGTYLGWDHLSSLFKKPADSDDTGVGDTDNSRAAADTPTPKTTTTTTNPPTSNPKQVTKVTGAGTNTNAKSTAVAPTTPTVTQASNNVPAAPSSAKQPDVSFMRYGTGPASFYQLINDHVTGDNFGNNPRNAALARAEYILNFYGAGDHVTKLNEARKDPRLKELAYKRALTDARELMVRNALRLINSGAYTGPAAILPLKLKMNGKDNKGRLNYHAYSLKDTNWLPFLYYLKTQSPHLLPVFPED